jgi:putative acetyltransferase
MSLTITPERPDSPDASALIAELDAVLQPLYAVESRHGYSVDKLIAEGVAFFVLRVDGVAAGCGGIKLVGTEYGEIKRMFVRSAWRGLGLSKAIVEHLAAYAQDHGISVLRLETGIHQVEAIGLYERMGFYRIPPFGPYFDDPVSLCYEKRLE